MRLGQDLTGFQRLGAEEPARQAALDLEIERFEGRQVQLVDLIEARVNRVAAGELGARCVEGGFGKSVVDGVELEADG